MYVCTHKHIYIYIYIHTTTPSIAQLLDQNLISPQQVCIDYIYVYIYIFIFFMIYNHAAAESQPHLAAACVYVSSVIYIFLLSCIRFGLPEIHVCIGIDIDIDIDTYQSK